MKKIFITGGAGFIGSHTVDLCVAEGCTVTVYDKKPWSEAVNLHSLEGKITYREGDILDVSNLEMHMRGHTHVLHLAAVVSVIQTIEEPLASHDVNVTGTLNVFECARRLGVSRVVYASSAAVYGAQMVMPIAEVAPTAPQSPYGVHKAINDSYAHVYTTLYGQSLLGLRYFNVFGPRQDPHSPYSGVISIFCERVKRNATILIYGDGTNTRDFISVYDVARANILALSTDCSGVCNIGTGVEVSLNALVRTLEVVGDTSISCEYQAPRPGDIARSCADVTQARRLLGFEPRGTLEDGVRSILHI